jgi:protein-tyrosine kinase
MKPQQVKNSSFEDSRSTPAEDESRFDAFVDTPRRPVDSFEETRMIDDPRDRLLGDLLREAKGLSGSQIDEVLGFQKEHNLRFGVAAVRMGLASEKDVLFALARQFRYPYAIEGSESYNAELVVGTDPFGEQAENFRELRSQLLHGVLKASSDGRRPALAVVSNDVADGKSFIAANLAVAFSQLGGRTLLIDADMRTPRQHSIFGFESSSGLSDVLAGRTKQQVIHRVAGIPSLYVMPLGAVPPNPAELVQSISFGLMLREMTSKFDYVIVDTPAATHGTDSRVIAAKCGAAMAIGRVGKTKTPELEALLTKIAKSRSKLAGVVMNEW